MNIEIKICLREDAMNKVNRNDTTDYLQCLKLVRD